MGVPDGKRSDARREIEIAMARDIFDVDTLGVGHKDRNCARHAAGDIPLTTCKEVGILLPRPLGLGYAGRCSVSLFRRHA
jgi:hypothetical protein